MTTKYCEQDVVSFDESGLIDELLLALVGINGDLFVDSSDIDRDDEKEETWQLPGPAECKVFVSPELTWISESDRQVLADLLRLGFHFKAVNAFVEGEHAPWDPRHTTRSPSVYRRALASGLTEMLDDYRCTVLSLQQELRREPAPALPTILHRMWEYTDVLPALHALAAAQDAVSLNRLFPAAELINSLQRGTRSGLPAVRQATGRLLWHCNQVLMQQLAAWMMHGMLQDPNQEFFIQTRAAAAAVAPQPQAQQQQQQPQQQQAQQHQQQQQMPASGWQQQQQQREEDGGGASTSGRVADDEAAYREWHGGFQVNSRCLPLYVSHDLAETILFVGRAVRVLRRPTGQGGGGGGGGGGAHELLPLQDMMQFGQAFTSLQSEPELSAPRLEVLVEGLRSHVARLLWRLLVGRAGLLPALAALKDYFLLGRGDFWQAFLAESRGLMAAPPRPSSVDADLALPFSRSAAKSSAEGDPLLAAFSLRYLGGAEAEAAFQIKSTSQHTSTSSEVPTLDPAWDPLALEVRLDWPLGLLLGRDQLRRYNQLFALLLRLRRMQGQLDDAWKDLRVMDRETQRSGGASVPLARMRDLQDLRNNMAFVVANLQIYIQTDVIEVNFSALENKIANCQDFSELERAHHLFLSTLMVQSFLTVRSLCAQLADVFQDVAALAKLVTRAGCDPHRLDFAAVSRLRVSFERHSRSLFSNFSSQRMIDSFRSPHLAQLVTRLNYNGFFGRNDGDKDIPHPSKAVGTR